MLHAFSISASGMTAERVRMDTIANNLANANTTRTPEGGPYRRQVPVFAAREWPSWQRMGFAGAGVRVVAIREDPGPFRLVYDPHHPDAGPDGYVRMPNVDVVREMVDLISATRAYEANVSAFNAAKTMAMRALDIGRA
ncbi:MAG: flagellar basal body rod protein FlgC [Firmicutes bacterium]|nr:flagellar basal body rod protein FlgC [Bacillota bacterium]